MKRLIIKKINRVVETRKQLNEKLPIGKNRVWIADLILKNFKPVYLTEIKFKVIKEDNLLNEDVKLSHKLLRH